MNPGVQCLLHIELLATGKVGNVEWNFHTFENIPSSIYLSNLIVYDIIFQPMSKKTTLALVGRGHWGQTYKRTINKMLNISLPDEFIFGRDYKSKLEKIKVQDIDGVIIAATTSSHFKIASYLLRNGFRNLLIEKPLTQTLYQAQNLAKMLRKMPTAKILVGHLMLYDPAWEKLKETSKKIGKILQINYTALQGPVVKEGTVLQDAGPHPIYLFMDIAGSKPVKVSAVATMYDNIELTLYFKGSLKGVAIIGTIYPERKRELIITSEF